jgi:hypothetical protein
VRAWTQAVVVHPSMAILSWALPQQQLTPIILMNYDHVETLAECHKSKNNWGWLIKCKWIGTEVGMEGYLFCPSACLPGTLSPWEPRCKRLSKAGAAYRELQMLGCACAGWPPSPPSTAPQAWAGIQNLDSLDSMRCIFEISRYLGSAVPKCAELAPMCVGKPPSVYLSRSSKRQRNLNLAWYQCLEYE